MGTRADATSRVRRWLATLPRALSARGVRAAYLFGSHARGDADESSDVDLILVAPSQYPFVERFRDYPELWLQAPTGIDLLIYTPEEFAAQRRCNRFVRHVLRTARRLV